MDIFDNKQVHNFATGTLDCYFKINALILKGKVVEYDGFFYLDRGATKMTMIYDSTKANTQLPVLEKLQKMGTIYSIDPIDLPHATQFPEVTYNLDVVFDPKSYKNAKKRRQHLSRPFKWLDKHGFTISHITADDYDDVIALHDIWTEKKLADPTTFKIMFPTGRYKRCIDIATEKQRYTRDSGGFESSIINLLPSEYRVFVVKDKDRKVVAIRVLSVQGKDAYGLAFFGDTWSTPSQLMHFADVVTLKMLMDEDGITYVNCGASLSSNLKSFKSHIPCSILTSWRYKRIKDVKEKHVISTSEQTLTAGFGIPYYKE